MEVAYHSQLSISEKRAILSAWVSSACAVEAGPLMRRQPETGHEARYDEIADAIKALDEEEGRQERAARAFDLNYAALRPGSAAIVGPMRRC